MSEQIFDEESSGDDLEVLIHRANAETNPQTRAVLWGQCILHVLNLNDIREGLTFEELRSMCNADASLYADHMKAVLEMRRPWRDGVPTRESRKCDTDFHTQSAINANAFSQPAREIPRGRIMPMRQAWPPNVARSILTKCHFRCCVCPEHRRIADIHHIDGDNSNSVEANGVALCKLCHDDAHTKSTMKRNLKPEYLIEFKRNWENACKNLEGMLTECGSSISNLYYLNVHRLDSLLRDIGEESVLSHVPHRPSSQPGAYNTLWANPKNPLDWTKLLENRNHFEARFKNAQRNMRLIDLNLFEVGAVDFSEHIGGLICFDCQFIGYDIPDQNELIESLGRIEGPLPTMRREFIDQSRDRILETCLMLDPQYMYSDSSFIHFSESGVWSGIARLTKMRESIGSHDGHMLRDQMVLTPICIGTPARQLKLDMVQSGQSDPEQQYLRLLHEQQIALPNPNETPQEGACM